MAAKEVANDCYVMSNDTEWEDKVTKYLQQNGKACINRHQAIPGRYDSENLIDAIKDSKKVIVGFTSDSSKLMGKEGYIAANVIHKMLEGSEEKQLIPVKISKDSQVPDVVSNLSVINYWEKDFYKKLLKALDNQFDVSVGRPIQIVGYDENGDLQFNDDEVSKLLISQELKDKPAVVVSIAGLKRKGKSLILNFLMKYLSCNCSKTWMEDKDTPLAGFEWRGGKSPVTTGMLMWNQVFCVEGPYGRKVHVILIDNEGCKSIGADVNNDAALFSLNLLFSSIQIFNIGSELDEGDIQFLEEAITYGEQLQLKEEKIDFQKLLFLIRDWPHVDEHEYGKNGGHEYLETSLEMIDKEGKLSKKFKKLQCFLLPIPDKSIMTGKSNGCNKDISGEFLDLLDEFLQMMLKAILSSNQNMTCGKIYNSFKNYVAVAKTKKMFFRREEMYAVAQCCKEFRKKEKEVEEQLNELQDKDHETIEDILKELEESKLKEFDDECKLKCQDYDVIKSELKDNIKMKIQKFKHNVIEKKELKRQKNDGILNNIFIDFKNQMERNYPIPFNKRFLMDQFKELEKKASKELEKHRNDFGSQLETYQEELEEKITDWCDSYCKENDLNKAEALNKEMTNLQIKAYKNACSRYENVLNKKLEKDHETEEDLEKCHKKAKYAALESYKQEVELIPGTTEYRMSEVEEYMMPDVDKYKNLEIAKYNMSYVEYVDFKKEIERIKRQNWRTVVNDKRINDQAHDKALNMYNDKMTSESTFRSSIEDDEKIKGAAIAEYKKHAICETPSYHKNLSDLISSIDKIKLEIKKKCTFFQYLLRLFYWLFGKSTCISYVIPQKFYKIVHFYNLQDNCSNPSPLKNVPMKLLNTTSSHAIAM